MSDPPKSLKIWMFNNVEQLLIRYLNESVNRIINNLSLIGCMCLAHFQAVSMVTMTLQFYDYFGCYYIIIYFCRRLLGFYLGDGSPLFFNLLEMWDKKHIEVVVDEVLSGSSFFAVDISVNKANLIRIFIDHPEQVTLDDCVEWHRRIEEKLDRDQEDYELQVSSAGLDQPLKDIRQYYKYIGQSLKILMDDGTQISGELKEVQQNEESKHFRIVIMPRRTKKQMDPAPESIEIEEIKTAKIDIVF